MTPEQDLAARPPATTNWAAVAVIFLAGVVAAMQFAKVPPVLEALRVDLALGAVASGFAVSIVGMVGLILGIAVGSIVTAIGFARSLRLGLLAGALFAVCGALATGPALFIASRLAEGFAHLVVVVTGPPLILASTASRDRPVALSVWGCFFSVGFAVTAALAPMIVLAVGWRGLFGVHAALLVIVALGVTFIVPGSGKAGPLPRIRDLLATHATVYTSGPPMLLAMVFSSYTMLYLAILTYLGIHLVTVDHLTEVETGARIGTLALINLVATLAVGPLMRFGLPSTGLFTASFLTVAAAAALVFAGLVTGFGSFLASAAMMVALGFLPGIVFATLPVVAPDSRRASFAASAIAQLGNVGTFSGPPLFAAGLSTIGWPGGAVFVAATCAIGIFLSYMLHLAAPNRI